MDEAFKRNLIDVVSRKPVLWDKTHPDYNSRVLCPEAWTNVCLELNPDYAEMSEIKKNIYMKEVMKRWRNIRDQWIKSYKLLLLQKRNGEPLKFYIYHEQLLFLEKNMLLIKADSEFSDEFDKNELNNRDFDEKEKIRKQKKTTGAHKKKYELQNKRKFNLNLHENESSFDADASDTSYQFDQNKLDDNEDSKAHTLKKYKIDPDKRPLKLFQEDDPKLHFFKSMLPYLKDFTDDEILQFQSGVLDLIRNIKKSRLNQSKDTQPSSSKCQSSSSQKYSSPHIEYVDVNSPASVAESETNTFSD